MKSFFQIVLAFAFLWGASEVKGQCNPQIHGMVFPFGVTDSITPSQYQPGPYYVCDNATLYYYGNNPDTVYLEGSARLSVGYSFNLVVYMRNNSALIMDTATANWQMSRIVHVYHDTLYTYFQDTAGVQIQGLTACPSMAYDYSLFPNNVSPCSLPSSVEPTAQDGVFSVDVYPNPAISEIFIAAHTVLPAPMQLMLLDSQGRQIRCEWTQDAQTRWDISELPTGIYLLGVKNGSRIAWQRLSIL